jgi:hypothetical protein
VNSIRKREEPNEDRIKKIRFEKAQAELANADSNSWIKHGPSRLLLDLKNKSQLEKYKT